MKPSAYKYELIDQDGMVSVIVSKEKNPDFHWVYSTPLYAIDFTKFKLVPIDPNDEQKRILRCYKAPHTVFKELLNAAPKIEDL
jgi:hypothetical protein